MKTKGEITVAGYLQGGVSYDQYVQSVVGDNMLLVCDIRGWGRIQHMFEKESDALTFQDKVGQFVADAINEKLQREANP